MKTHLIFLAGLLLAFTPPSREPVGKEMAAAVQTFVNSLDADQRKLAVFPFDSEERFDWHYVPRKRNGLPLKQMNPQQRKAAMVLLKTALSDQGYEKVTSIIDLENVLRVVENRPSNDTYRDPENYSFSVFGDVSNKTPWGWRVDGHHLSLHFSSLTGKVIGMTPTFLGSNPGVVRADVPQKGRQILKQEEALALALVTSFNSDQLGRALISETCPGDIVTTNTRKASIEKKEGIAFPQMTESQQKTFLSLLETYLNNYHVTLKNQQLDKLKKVGLDKLVFAWAGDRQAGFGPGKGQYYRIQGPTILIEYDNSQNNANHVHSVVRDLTNDFGEDILAEHYKAQHK
ncbi:DUF3500 domain-containing protein [Larkinella insperata]|uniref:DUF3500 domain-containing protein n=1 Tax=Larkinella insperata TaxID=332158 RepID=A0ABW3Q2Z1_9BACT|nr:DUF3500 domain-containing protein [Larkinella insperata]